MNILKSREDLIVDVLDVAFFAGNEEVPLREIRQALYIISITDQKNQTIDELYRLILNFLFVEVINNYGARPDVLSYPSLTFKNFKNILSMSSRLHRHFLYQLFYGDLNNQNIGRIAIVLSDYYSNNVQNLIYTPNGNLLKNDSYDITGAKNIFERMTTLIHHSMEPDYYKNFINNTFNDQDDPVLEEFIQFYLDSIQENNYTDFYKSNHYIMVNSHIDVFPYMNEYYVIKEYNTHINQQMFINQYIFKRFFKLFEHHSGCDAFENKMKNNSENYCFHLKKFQNNLTSSKNATNSFIDLLKLNDDNYFIDFYNKYSLFEFLDFEEQEEYFSFFEKINWSNEKELYDSLVEYCLKYDLSVEEHITLDHKDFLKKNIEIFAKNFTKSMTYHGYHHLVSHNICVIYFMVFKYFSINEFTELFQALCKVTYVDNSESYRNSSNSRGKGTQLISNFTKFKITSDKIEFNVKDEYCVPLIK